MVHLPLFILYKYIECMSVVYNYKRVQRYVSDSRICSQKVNLSNLMYANFSDNMNTVEEFSPTCRKGLYLQEVLAVVLFLLSN